MQIDIVSDVVCPWCYIGKRNLEKALALWREANPEAAEPEVHWQPFQLNPDIAPQGLPRKTYLEHKFGGPSRAQEIYARVKHAGAQAGIEFDFDRIQMQPNTLEAHRLIHWSLSQGKQDELVEALFQGYFLRGLDLTQGEVLCALAQEAGIAQEDAQAYLAGDQDRALVTQKDFQARQMGISGVPFFIFNQRVALSGAHPPEALLTALRRSDFTQG